MSEVIKKKSLGYTAEEVDSALKKSILSYTGLNEIKEDLAYLVNCEIIKFSNGFIKHNDGVIDVNNITPNDVWQYAVVTCAHGDKFTLNLSIGASTVLYCWAFIDSDGNIIKHSINARYTDSVVTAPVNASKLVLHSREESLCLKGIHEINNINHEMLVLNSDLDKLNRKVFTGEIYCECEIGGWISKNGELIKETNSKRIRLAKIEGLKEGKYTCIGHNNDRIVVFFSDADNNYISSMSHNTYVEEEWWIYTHTSDSQAYYMYVMLINRAESDITEQELNEVKSTSYVLYESPNQQNAYGKNVNVYRFGGNGNDWCFVRTPSNYNPNRNKPYPFVICNHGNGWVMDGTIQKANWTKRTMYVPMDDADYVSNPKQYNGTDDSSLWYSNPTIEMFLNNGYIVCGCENYADNLFGNDNCRNACVDFFYHMVNNYNVEKRCYMIGASNGAQTTINACYLLGEKVKAIILQYPLTCLTDHYENYPKHQSTIRSAYGITDSSITKDNLIKATATHDFMHTNVVANTKVGYFPPTKLYYSKQDVIVNCNVNAIAMYNMLVKSLKVAEKVECRGQHGDYTHFNPNEYLEWFEKY